MLQLAVPPVVTTFKTTQFIDLQHHLESIESSTEIVPIQNVKELTLDKDHKAQTLSLSTVALSQLCKFMCPGLLKLLLDLDGTSLSAGSPRKTNISLAIAIYNNVLQTRFNTLEEHSLVKDLKSKQISGIIGLGYRPLSNKHFFDMVKDAIATEEIPCVFHDATLIGRTLILSYKSARPLIERPEAYHSGFYFTNSEVGDCSVKLAYLLLREKDGLRAINPLKKGRLIHLGKDFIKKSQV